MHITLELLTERFDQSRSETALIRSPNRWAVLLSPFQMQTRRLGIERPGDVDAATRAQKRGLQLGLLGRKLRQIAWMSRRAERWFAGA